MKYVMLVSVALFGAAPLLSAGEIKDQHRKLVGEQASDPEKARTFEEIDSHAHGITEIGLERTPCYGKCPVYTAVLKADGTFRFHGVDNVRHIGRFTGKIEEHEFNNLAQFIVGCDYFEMEDTYEALVTDHPDVYSTVVRKGQRKVIRNYANAGPPTLWAIEQLIDKLILTAEWNEHPVK